MASSPKRGRGHRGEEGSLDQGKRNTAFLFIGAGVYLAVGHLVNFFTAGALATALLGYAIVRSTEGTERKDLSGYVLLAGSAIVLLANHAGFLVVGLVAGAVWFLRSKRRPGAVPGGTDPFDPSFVKQHIVASVRWGRGGEPWTARSSQLSVAIAEIQIDLTNAIFEEPTVELHLQGMIGDVDIVVPEDVGLAVHAQVAVGEIRVAGERGAGLLNRLVWRSPNYETAEHRVLLNVSYAVADVDVKVL